MSLGKNIKELRKKEGLTQAELAEMLGINTNESISRWENDLHRPSTKILEKLTFIFNTDFNSLFRE